jgi:two-component system OmpR family sensor kinase
MSHLVDDLLTLARLDAGRPLGAEPVDVVRIALDAVDDARIAFADHRWQLELPERDLAVTGEATALAQVVTNLFANAAVHTPPGTTVTVTVRSVTEPGRGSVQLIVADDGPGMSADIAAHAFDRFVRGGAGERSVTRGSSGLGLPIVAAIVAAHHGTVDLASGAGGTTVTVTLPLASMTAATRADQS